MADYVNNRVLGYTGVVPPAVAISCTTSSLGLELWSNCAVSLKGFNGTVEGKTVSVAQTGGTGSVILLGTCTLTSAGTCSIGAMGTMVGHVTLRASYAGDPDNGGAYGTASLYVYAFEPPYPPLKPC